MSKKAIIISIVSVILISGLVVLGLILVNGKQNTPDQTSESKGPQPGDSVAITKTPEYKACQLFTSDSLQTILGDKVSAVVNGERSGSIAANFEIADQCDYDFTTATSKDNELSIQVYQYSVSTEGSNLEQYDATWRNINVIADPEYTKGYPAYYKSSNVDDKKIFQMYVIGGAKNFRFAISQPLSSQYFSDQEVVAMMIKFANDANYDVANSTSEDVPPAPNV